MHLRPFSKFQWSPRTPLVILGSDVSPLFWKVTRSGLHEETSIKLVKVGGITSGFAWRRGEEKDKSFVELDVNATACTVNWSPGTPLGLSRYKYP